MALLLTLRDGGARLVSTGNLNTTQPDAVEALRAEGITVIGGPTRGSEVHASYLDEVLDPRSADFARSAEVAAGPGWKPRPDPPSANEWLSACHGSVRLMPG